MKELSTTLARINKETNRATLLAIVKTFFFSGEDGVFHPMFKETKLLKKFRTQLKIFELCIRNFEETYIAMIKEL